MNYTSKADQAVKFISKLKLTGDYHGQPFKLRPWQEDFVRRLFSVGPDGKKIYKTATFILPRKQSKTFLISSIVLYLISMEGKSSQEIYSAASSVEQSGKIFSYCVAIINQCPWLRDRCRILHNRKEIEFVPKVNIYRSLSSQSSTAHGLSPNVCITDELAQWEPRKGRLLYEALSTGFGHTQDGGLFIHISTAGNNKHSLLWEEYQYAKKVIADPTYDPSYLAVIYEADQADDWKSPITWHKAMPALSDFCSIEFIRNQCLQAQRIKTREASFRQYFLNQWVEGNALQWFDISLFDACAATYEIEPGTPAIAGGIDVGLQHDLSVLVLLFESEGKYRIKTWAWIAEEALEERQAEDFCPYKDWIKSGALIAHPGKGTDFRLLRKQINDINNTYPIMQLGADPWNTAQLVQELENDGIPVVRYRQTFASLSPACKTLENWLMTNQLEHNTDVVIRQHLLNTRVEIDSNENIKPNKIKSTGRIDGTLALCMSIGIAIGSDPNPGEIYTIAI